QEVLAVGRDEHAHGAGLLLAPAVHQAGLEGEARLGGGLGGLVRLRVRREPDAPAGDEGDEGRGREHQQERAAGGDGHGWFLCRGRAVMIRGSCVAATRRLSQNRRRGVDGRKRRAEPWRRDGTSTGGGTGSTGSSTWSRNGAAPPRSP